MMTLGASAVAATSIGPNDIAQDDTCQSLPASRVSPVDITQLCLVKVSFRIQVFEPQPLDLPLSGAARWFGRFLAASKQHARQQGNHWALKRSTKQSHGH